MAKKQRDARPSPGGKPKNSSDANRSNSKIQKDGMRSASTVRRRRRAHAGASASRLGACRHSHAHQQCIS